MSLPERITGHRHPPQVDGARECCCGCQHVVDAVGELVHDDDTPKLAGLGIGIYRFEVPSITGGRPYTYEVAYEPATEGARP